MESTTIIHTHHGEDGSSDFISGRAGMTVSAVESGGGDGSVHRLKRAKISKDWENGGGKG